MFGLVGLLTPRLGGTIAKLVVYGGAILLALLAIWYYGHTRYQAGVQHVQAEIARANVRYLEQKARADDLAAKQRLTDTIAVSTRERELRDAIASTPDGAPDAVRIRLGCERLRRAHGANQANLPTVCRPGG